MRTLNKGKGLKRVFYRGKVTKFKKLISVMAAVGLIFSALYFCKVAYIEYAASKADVVLTFPQIAQSKYPDGSRFTYYDFISDENLEAALNIMQAEGKYKNFTVEDLRNQFYIYSYLESSAGASVSVARSEGNDFSYVANEYKITFIQPHDYKNENILNKFIAEDYSSDFLKALIEVNRIRIAEELGGINSFKKMTEISHEGSYDYSEELSIYRTKINTIMSYLKYLDRKESNFVPTTHDLSLSDIEGRYAFLISNSLDGISDFVETSGISKDVELASNKLRVNIENNSLKFDKAWDRAQINYYAMANYDQTFTENLINVVQNEEYGLYQARPKTAFDTVTVQKHESDESIAEYGSKINEYNRELEIFNSIVREPEEHDRLIAKCEELMTQFKKEYEEISSIACEVVTEYYNDVNENFITAKIRDRGLISKGLIIKTGFVFALGAVFAFVFVVFASSVRDSQKLKRKKKLIKSIKQTAEEKGA